MQSKGEIALKEMRALRAVRVGLGFEGPEVRNKKQKQKKRIRMKEKSRKSNLGESSRVGLSLFQALAMEKDCVSYRSKLQGKFSQGILFQIWICQMVLRARSQGTKCSFSSEKESK